MKLLAVSLLMLSHFGKTFGRSYKHQKRRNMILEQSYTDEYFSNVTAALLIVAVAATCVELGRRWRRGRKEKCMLCEKEVGAEEWGAHRRRCAEDNRVRLDREFPAHGTARCAGCAERIRIVKTDGKEKAEAVCGDGRECGEGEVDVRWWQCCLRTGRSKSSKREVLYRCYACDVDVCQECADAAPPPIAPTGSKNSNGRRGSYLKKRYGVSAMPASGSTRGARLPPTVTCNPLFSAVDVATDGSVSSACRQVVALAGKTSSAVASVSSLPAALAASFSGSAGRLAAMSSGSPGRVTKDDVAVDGGAGGGGLAAPAIPRCFLRQNSSAPDLTTLVSDEPSSSHRPPFADALPKVNPKFVIPSRKIEIV